jgi:hypothetical protein
LFLARKIGSTINIWHWFFSWVIISLINYSDCFFFPSRSTLFFSSLIRICSLIDSLQTVLEKKRW